MIKKESPIAGDDRSFCFDDLSSRNHQDDGHNAFLLQVCRLVSDFALSPSSARTIAELAYASRQVR
jgi:hypothetical protein